MRRAKSKKFFWLILIVALIAAYFGYRYFTNKGESKPVFEQVKIVRGDIEITVLTTGVVGPENRIQIKPPIAGRIEELLVDEGYQVKKGNILAYMSSTERAALLDAASAEGEKALKEWERLYRRAAIVAPVDGTIIKRNMQEGQSFVQGEAIFDMSDRLTISAQVDETDIAQVKLGQQASIVLDAYPETIFKGRVHKIAYDSTLTNNVTTYVVVILPEQIPSYARSGMTANVTFEIEAKKGVLILPANAVKIQDGKTLVLLPSTIKDAAPQEHEIKTGLSNGKTYEVIAGLKENDIILVPEFKLEDGAQAGNPFSPFGARPGTRPGARPTGRN